MKHALKFSFVLTITAIAQSNKPKDESRFLLTSRKFSLGIAESDIIVSSRSLNVIAVKANSKNESIVSNNAHAAGRCGGYEKIFEDETSSLNALNQTNAAQILIKDLEKNSAKSFQVKQVSSKTLLSAFNQSKAVNAQNIGENIRWYSSFHTRFHGSPEANTPVGELKNKLSKMIESISHATIQEVSHQSTPQKSLQVLLKGTDSNLPAVVLGGHLDSISGWGFGNSHAPGADDNASGVGALMEALRVLSTSERAAHDIYIFFYAGEEAGLLGSAEIAKQFKRNGKLVRGVLQLDMTMFPGDGAFVISSMTDFTHPNLRLWLKDFNNQGLGATIIEDECGYGCSDHASWHRQGFAALMPFESTFDNMNPDIHTARDVVSSRSNFDHAALFSKIAVGFALSAP